MGRGKSLLKIDFFIYLFFGLFALTMLKPSLNLGLGEIGEVGPGFLPFLALLCVLSMSAVLAILNLLPRRRPVPSAPLEKIDSKAYIRMGEILLSLAIWPLLVGIIGFILATFIVGVGMSKAIGYEGWMRPMILSGSLAFSIWFIFGFLFYVDLPAWFSF